MQIKQNQVVVAFDIADQSFRLFNPEQWVQFVSDARNELQDELNDCDPDAEDLGEAYHWDVDEVLERMYGDELFWDVLDAV